MGGRKDRLYLEDLVLRSPSGLGYLGDLILDTRDFLWRSPGGGRKVLVWGKRLGEYKPS